jgi:putative MATE family efflux protein
MIPVIFQNIIIFSLNMIDSIMLSKYGQSEFAASSLANQAWFIYTVFMFGLSTGTCILTSQYFGKRDKISISSVMFIGLMFSLGVSIVFFIFLFFAPEIILRIFTNDENLVMLGSKYARIIAPSYLFTAITMLYGTYLKSVEKASAPLIFNGIALILNTVLNYFLIFGVGTLKPMGIEGAAIATLISRAVEILIMIYYFKNFEKFISLKVDFEKIKFLLPDFLKYCSPVLINEALWGVGASFHIAIFGRMGETVIAAFSVTNILERIGMIASFGLVQAAGVILGIELGQGNKEQALKYSSNFLKISGLFGLVCGAIVYFSTPLIISIFSLGKETALLYSQFVLIMAIFLVIKAFNIMGICSILRSGGDSVAALMIDVGAMWLLTNPIGAILGLKLGILPAIVYLVFILEEFIKLPIMLYRVKKQYWIQNLTR